MCPPLIAATVVSLLSQSVHAQSLQVMHQPPGESDVMLRHLARNGDWAAGDIGGVSNPLPVVTLRNDMPHMVTLPSQWNAGRSEAVRDDGCLGLLTQTGSVSPRGASLRAT